MNGRRYPKDLGPPTPLIHTTMQTLTVDSGGAASAAVSVSPGRHIVHVRAGTANLGTLSVKEAWGEIDGDTGSDIAIDDLGTPAEYDLSAVSSAGFEVAIGEAGTLIIAISGGSEDQTLHYSVRRIA